MRFAVSYITPNASHGQQVVDAYDNIEAAAKVREILPGIKVTGITQVSGGEPVILEEYHEQPETD